MRCKSALQGGGAIRATMGVVLFAAQHRARGQGSLASAPGKGTEVGSGEQTFRRRVLVVDDEPLNRELLRRVLQREYDVIEAEDAFQALDILKDQQDQIQAVLCDQLMPGCSGTQLAEEVRSRWPDVRFLLLTGYDDDPEIKAAEYSGLVSSVVAKPWRSKDLRALLREVLG